MHHRLAGIGTLFFDVAYQSCYPTVVGPEHLVDGNSRIQATAAGASIVGPGFAGLLVQVFTAPFAMIADACSCLASVGFLLAIRPSADIRVVETTAPTAVRISSTAD